MLGLRHRHLLYLPPNGMETLRANGVENSMPRLELAVVGGPAKPGASGGPPGAVMGGLGGPRRRRASPVPSAQQH